MRRFYLYRKEDATGVSGTGRVADGVEFENGVVCLTWKSQFQSVTMFPSISLVEKLHTHLGQHDTEIIWVDEIHEDIVEKSKLLAKREAEEAAARAEKEARLEAEATEVEKPKIKKKTKTSRTRKKEET